MKKLCLTLLLIVVVPFYFSYASSDLLTIEENAWLESRNNTITIVPERNNPPVSFSNPLMGEPQGIFIDHIDLIAKKLGVEVRYLSARTRIDVIDSLKQGNNDYIGSLGVDKVDELGLISTKPYFTTPVVIAVREDFEIGKGGVTLDYFNGKKVSVLAGSATSVYVKRNYPKVIFEEVVDNELALQKVILSEVDAVVINTASLKYYLSNQTVKSIKVAGVISGLSVNLALAVPKDQVLLKSILEKGLAQVSAQEHEELASRWEKSIPKDGKERIFGMDTFGIIIISSLGFIIFLWILIRRTHRIDTRISSGESELSSGHGIKDIKAKIAVLQQTNQEIARELDVIDNLEKKIEEEVEELK
jgi:ABC-type amino acid transport substrate-binding protein